MVPCNQCGQITKYPFDLPGGKLVCEKCYHNQPCNDCDSTPLQEADCSVIEAEWQETDYRGDDWQETDEYDPEKPLSDTNEIPF